MVEFGERMKRRSGLSLIDKILFNQNNSFWVKAFNYPCEGDIIDRMKVSSVGLFTFNFC